MLPAGPYLFVLPYPVTPPGPGARLGGMACVRTDARFSPLGKMEFLPCRIPEHALPSPSYLFAQGLDPHILQNAPCESEFYAQVQERFSVPGTRVITWSARHLQALNAAALRLLRRPGLTGLPASLTAMNRVLQASYVFGALNKRPGRDLLSCARMLGSTQQLPRFSPEGRLQALLYVASLMAEGDEAVFAFQLRSVPQRLEAWKQACAGKKLLVNLNSAGTVELVRPLECTGEGLLKALRFDGAEASLWHYLPEDCELLAPSGIMTAERCRRLGFDMDAAVQALQNCGPADFEDQRRLPYWLAFFDRLSPADRELYAGLGDKAPAALEDPGSKYSDFLRSWILWCRGDNSRGSLTDEELQRYSRNSRAEAGARLNVYLKETAALQHHASENSPDDPKLIERIQRYVLEL